MEFELKLVQREKFEEEERKKKEEDKEETKFDYLTLLANTTKKYGNLRRGGNAVYKTGAKKLIANSGPIRPPLFQSPPVIGKGNGISIDIQSKNSSTG